MQIAEPASIVAALRIDARIARREAAPEFIEFDAPSGKKRFPGVVVCGHDAALLRYRLHARQQIVLARDALEFRLSRPDHCEGGRRHVFAAAECVKRYLRLIGTRAQPRGYRSGTGL